MMVFIAPDKFKGSLTTFEACEAIASGIITANAGIQVKCFPMSDGGDGFAAVLKHYLHTATILCNTTDALGRMMEANYEWKADTNTAIIEVAAASGAAILQQAELDVLHATTYGTGLLIADAIKRGAKEIVLGLGGSATNDAGTGILAALGWTFLNEEGKELFPCGASLACIRDIHPPGVLPGVQFAIACDVTNPLYGPNGAANVYAGQKGADDATIEALDFGLMNYAAVIRKLSNVDVNIAGAGAAGGIASSLLPWFTTTMLSGADFVLKASGLLSQLREADWLITGEGKFDQQSLHGKLLSRLLKAADKYDISVAMICGKLELDEQSFNKVGLKKVMPVCKSGMAAQHCMEHAAELLLHEAKTFGIELTA